VLRVVRSQKMRYELTAMQNVENGEVWSGYRSHSSHRQYHHLTERIGLRLPTTVIETVRIFYRLQDSQFCRKSPNFSWWRGTVVERRSLAGELSLSCARPAADG